MAVLALVAVAAGVWLGRPDPEAPRKEQKAATTRAQTVPVPVVVDSPRRGDVRLRFPSGPGIEGVQSFFVVRDGTVAAQGLSPSDVDWSAADLDPGTQHCWAVFAVVEVPAKAPSPTATPEPACLSADGRSG